MLLGLNDWNYHFQLGDGAGLANQIPPRGFWTPFEEVFSPFPKFHDSAIHRALSNLRRRASGQPTAVSRWNPGHLRPAKSGTIPVERGEFYAKQVFYTARKKFRPFKIDQVSLQFLKDYRRLMKECETVRCLIVNQPTAYGPDISERMKSKLWMTPPMVDWAAPLKDIEAAQDVYNRFIISAAKRNRIATCGAVGRLPRDEGNFYDDAHFSQKGSREFANLAGTCFVESFLTN